MPLDYDTVFQLIQDLRGIRDGRPLSVEEEIALRAYESRIANMDPPMLEYKADQQMDLEEDI